MKRPSAWFGLSVIGGVVLPLISGCTQLAGWKGLPAPPIQTPPVNTKGPTSARPEIEQVGEASWYGPGLHGKATASGRIFDANKLTAAHRTLPLGTKATVTNLTNGKSVTVTITDRGPYAKGRKIDLSRASARKIGISKRTGVAKVKIQPKPHQIVARRATRQTHGKRSSASMSVQDGKL